MARAPGAAHVRYLDGQRRRGTTRTLIVTRLCSNKKLPNGAPKTRAIQPMDAVRGSLKPLQRLVRRQEESLAIQPGGWPREVERCRQSGRKGLIALQREQSLPEGLAVSPADALYTGANLKRLTEALEAAAQTRARAEERARVRAWKQWINKAWDATPGMVYR